MSEHRIEKDSFGEIAVPAARLWGAQTERSLHHFDISTEKMPLELIRALALVKRSTAVVNLGLGTLDAKKAAAIVAAADEVLAGQHDAEFPLAVWQTGSGTQSNMNMNEVLANRASQLLGGPVGDARLVHPNDEVNRSQSSNDAELRRDCDLQVAVQRLPTDAMQSSDIGHGQLTLVVLLLSLPDGSRRELTLTPARATSGTGCCQS